MNRLLRQTENKFIATIILTICAIIALTWLSLQLYNNRVISTPADSKALHSTSVQNEAFADYLEEQKAYEAHFIALASDVKEQDATQLTNALALISVGAVSVGVIAAIFVGKRLMKPVREAYASQERFIQDAAHELRNPLAAMTIALQQTKVTKENHKLIDTFRRQTRRLVSINEDLLFLERQSTQKPVQLSLDELLQDIVEELQPFAIKKKITLKVTSDKGINKKMAPGDYVRLVKNLVDNAIKYSPIQSTIQISQKQVKNHVELMVADKGIGIPKEDVEKIGSRFFRASNVGKIDGTGLGMAIVRKILNRYDGSFKINSIPKKGTVVTVSFPLS